LGAEVRQGEWHLVALFFANLFLLLGAYYILKVIREPLILLEGGAVERSYARGLQAGLLLVLIPAYGMLIDRFEPAKVVKWIMGGFVACVAAFVALGEAGMRVGFAFFVWLGIFSTVAIAQFWSLATDVLTESEGKRLFPMIAAGGTLGGICGAQLAARMLDGHPRPLMLLAAALLVSCALLSHMTHEAAMDHRARIPRDAPQRRDARGGLALVVQDRYLLLIAIAVLILNFLNTTGDFVLSQVVSSKASLLSSKALEQQYIARFYGNFQTQVAVVASCVQVCLVARVFSKVGVGASLYVLPLVVLLGYGASALAPALALVASVKVLQDGAEYSLQNTAQQALFLRTSRDAKYKAKAAIDTLFVRFGDIASTGLVVLGTRLGMGVKGYAVVNVVFGAVWLLVVLRLQRHEAFPRSTPSNGSRPVTPA
jgi:AAA family ATP:ADP antiporter